ncbi:MAG: hypothetical protein AAGF56_06875 [Pseudomonadota bacterium]
MIVLGWTTDKAALPKGIRRDWNGGLATLYTDNPNTTPQTRMALQLGCHDACNSFLPTAPVSQVTLGEARQCDTDHLYDALQAVAGKAQLTLSVTWSGKQFSAPSETGRNWLDQRSRAYHDNQQFARKVMNWAAAAAPRQINLRQGKTTICCDILLDKSEMPTAQRKISQAVAQAQISGAIQPMLSGPWPVYSFVPDIARCAA